MNRRAFLAAVLAALATTRAQASPVPLAIEYHRYEGDEWDCFLKSGIAKWVYRGKTLKQYRLTRAQLDGLVKALADNRFFSLPPEIVHRTRDDTDTLKVTLYGKTHTVTANGGGGDKTKPFYAVLDALKKVAPVPMDEIRKMSGNR